MSSQVLWTDLHSSEESRVSHPQSSLTDRERSDSAPFYGNDPYSGHIPFETISFEEDRWVSVNDDDLVWSSDTELFAHNSIGISPDETTTPSIDVSRKHISDVSLNKAHHTETPATHMVTSITCSICLGDVTSMSPLMLAILGRELSLVCSHLSFKSHHCLSPSSVRVAVKSLRSSQVLRQHCGKLCRQTLCRVYECEHLFHYRCVSQWDLSKGCPNCRARTSMESINAFKRKMTQLFPLQNPLAPSSSSMPQVDPQVASPTLHSNDSHDTSDGIFFAGIRLVSDDHEASRNRSVLNLTEHSQMFSSVLKFLLFACICLLSQFLFASLVTYYHIDEAFGQQSCTPVGCSTFSQNITGLSTPPEFAQGHLVCEYKENAANEAVYGMMFPFLFNFASTFIMVPLLWFHHKLLVCIYRRFGSSIFQPSIYQKLGTFHIVFQSIALMIYITAIIFTSITVCVQPCQKDIRMCSVQSDPRNSSLYSIAFHLDDLCGNRICTGIHSTVMTFVTLGLSILSGFFSFILIFLQT